MKAKIIVKLPIIAADTPFVVLLARIPSTIDVADTGIPIRGTIHVRRLAIDIPSACAPSDSLSLLICILIVKPM